jgi:hypothetical protein
VGDKRIVRTRARLSVETIVQARRQLGLFDTATRREIEEAYHRLVVHVHPDRCADARRVNCLRQSQEITAAYQLLRDVLARYRYSLRTEDIRRDQEDAQLKHLRQFGTGLWASDEPLPSRITHGTPLRGEMYVTAENVEWARSLLKLPQLVTARQVHRRYRTLAVKQHPDRHGARNRRTAGSQFVDIERAHRLLTIMLDNYHYSFRAADLRHDQPHLFDIDSHESQ